MGFKSFVKNIKINIQLKKLEKLYKPVEILGSGMSGITYKSIDKTDNQLVAVKVFFKKPKLYTEEVEILKFINKHCNFFICLKEHMDLGDIQAIVTNLIDGISLSDVIVDVINYDIKDIENIMKSLIEYTKMLHQMGLAHQDIKPDNIMYDKAHKKLFLIDFGVACNKDLCIPSGASGFSSKTKLNAYYNDKYLSLDKAKADDIFAIGVIAKKIDIALKGKSSFIKEIRKVYHQQSIKKRMKLIN